ncbi:MAG: phenylalanine--tRNA ligase subunit beta [bacterium]|nr:phenylalanine--tRNA ligase subunit beta [bacterium]
MKISYSILKQLVPDLTLSPKDLAELLTMHSFETVIEREYVIDPSIMAVKILKLDPHPNADRLRMATVTDGTNEYRVVCGAPNIEVGQIVPYAPPGARVYDEHKELFTLKEAVIRGEKSPGMLNSIRELGVSDDHGGIVILPEDTVLGSSVVEMIPSDAILDISVLPDRAKDANTHLGIAREVAALIALRVDESNVANSQILFLQHIAGIASIGSVDQSSSAHEHRAIVFDPQKPSRVAGIEISSEKVRDIIERLRFVVSPPARGGAGGGGSGEVWQVTAPPDRLDITGEHDVVDEVVRFHGLDSIPPAAQDFSNPLLVPPAVYWSARIRNLLAESGFTETYSYSFEDERFAKWVNSEIHPHVELQNPIAPNLKKLRYSMLPGLIGAMVKSRDDILRNKKGQSRAMFEIGRVYHVGEGGVVPGIIERPVVAGIAVGDESTLQEIITRIRELFGIESLTVTEGTKPFGTVNFLKYADEFFGITYNVSDDLLKKMKYNVPVVAFEISLNALVKHAKDVEIPVKSLEDIRKEKLIPAQFQELPKYPSVFRDISLLIESRVGIDAVESEIWRVGKNIVVDVELFDEYQHDKKGLAFHIEYRNSEKTLTDSEVDEVHKKIEHALKKEFGAIVR